MSEGPLENNVFVCHDRHQVCTIHTTSNQIRLLSARQDPIDFIDTEKDELCPIAPLRSCKGQVYFVQKEKNSL